MAGNSNYNRQYAMTSAYSQSTLQRHESNSSLYKKIPPLRDTELQEISWDSEPTRNLFQQLLEEIDIKINSSKPNQRDISPETSLCKPMVISQHGCKCSKIGCLKLYCECFTRGEMCGPNCICVSCQNCLGNSTKILSAQQMANFRKPGTFIGVKAYVPQRKCTCKKSKCQKKYCECFSAGEKCGPSCDCIGCENHDHIHDTRPDCPYRMEIETQA